MDRVNPRYTRHAIVRGAASTRLIGLVVLADPVPSLGRRTKDKDCRDFTTQNQTQRFFQRSKPGDPHRLNADHDGKACESLP